MMHWISDAFSTYVLHVQNHNGYQLWSGAGANFGEITVIGLVIGAYRHINCDAPRCWRRGPHKTADGQHKLCRKHHPDLPSHRLSLGEIHLRHHESKENQPS
jgi:hypothetical protein